jgi:O-antigen/teichoic acid export membrane protein
VSYTLGLSLWLAAGIVVFNRPVIELWMGSPELVDDRASYAMAFFVVTASFNCILTHFLIVEGRLARYPLVVVASGAASITLGLLWAPSYGLSGIIWGAAIGHSITTVFLVRRNARAVDEPIARMLMQVVVRALRCAAAGIGVCVGYLVLREAGMPISWYAAAAISAAFGVFGFALAGLVEADRKMLIEGIRARFYAA